MYNFRQGFAYRLRKSREAAHLSQQEIAERLSISRTAYTYYETGHTSPRLETLAEISRILDVSVDYLLGQS